MTTITPRDALRDPRFPVLGGADADDLRDFVRTTDGGAAGERPHLPAGWRWSADQPGALVIPRRWRIATDGYHDECDERPSAADLWDRVTPGASTAWYSCAVIDTWTGEEHHETHTVEPDEPECVDGSSKHRWDSPIALVGGIADNPGIQGKGGSVLIHEVCRRCGSHRRTDTWATDPATGEDGLRSVSYTGPDTRSEAYAAASRLLDAARLDDRAEIADAVADVDGGLQRSVSVEDAVTAGVCRNGAERWIGRHRTISLDRIGRVLHRLGKADRIELAEAIATVVTSRAAHPEPA